jgi:excisionase family DNA binding protein
VDSTAVSDHPQQPSRQILFEKKYTVPQAARMLGLGATKLRDIIRRGEIPVVMLDGKHLLLERDLEAFLHHSYGSIKEVEVKKAGLAPLPDSVANSPYLRKAK